MSDRTQPSVLQPLQQATEGLLFISETDAPLVPFFWPQENPVKITPDVLLPLAGVATDAPVKPVKLEAFFRPATKEEDWHNDEERAEAKRFQDLVRTVKSTLKDVVVFRVGEVKIDVFIVGVVEGGYAGLKTQIVET